MKAHRPVKPESEHACVLYDPKDGRIVHTHCIVTLPGGQKVTHKEVEARAKEVAKQAGHDIGELSVMHFAADAYDASTVYHVDLTTKQLVKLEPSQRLQAP